MSVLMGLCGAATVLGLAVALLVRREGRRGDGHTLWHGRDAVDGPREARREARAAHGMNSTTQDLRAMRRRG
ncbi:hypothetical protein ACWGJ2_11595 [Streptomyces sp. NPDC054796]